MSWDSFLETLFNRPEYGLLSLAAEVVMCLQEAQYPTKSELLEAYSELPDTNRLGGRVLASNFIGECLRRGRYPSSLRSYLPSIGSRASS